MEKVIVRKPFDDSVMKWNTETSRYELTMAYVKAHFDNSTGDDKRLQDRITKCSRIVYNYIMSRIYRQNNCVVTFFLNKTLGGRNLLKEVLHSQMEADLESGFNDIGIQNLVNFANGQVIDRNIVKQNMICLEAESILENCDSYVGVNLFYQCIFPTKLFMLARENGD